MRIVRVNYMGEREREKKIERHRKKHIERERGSGTQEADPQCHAFES